MTDDEAIARHPKAKPALRQISHDEWHVLLEDGAGAVAYFGYIGRMTGGEWRFVLGGGDYWPPIYIGTAAFGTPIEEDQ